jgi:hypothetical protein
MELLEFRRTHGGRILGIRNFAFHVQSKYFFYIKEGLSPKENYNMVNLKIFVSALSSRKICVI